MLISLINNRKPTALLTLLLGALLVVVLHRSLLLEPFFGALFLVETIAIFVLLSLNILVVSRIDQQNGFSNGNSYFAFFFLCLVGLLPSVFVSYHYLLSNLLVLLCIYALLSIHRGGIPEKAFLDASLLASLAFLSHQSLVLVVVVVFLAILLFTPRTYKNYLIPLIAIGVVAMGVHLYYLYIDEGFSLDTPNFELFPDKFTNLYYVFSLLMLLLSVLWLCFFFYLHNKIQRTCYWLFLLMLPLGFVQELFMQEQLLGILCFVIIPLSTYAKFLLEYLHHSKLCYAVVSLLLLFLLIQFLVLKYA